MSPHLTFRVFPGLIPAFFPSMSLTGLLFSPNWPSGHSLDKTSASLTVPSALSMPFSTCWNGTQPWLKPALSCHLLSPTPWPHSTELVPLLSTSMLCLSIFPARFSLPWMKEPSIPHLCITASALPYQCCPPWHGVGPQQVFVKWMNGWSNPTSLFYSG